MRNGSATPREEGFAKQTQVMLLRGWSADDVTAEANPVSIKWSRCWTVSRKQKRFTMVKGYSKDVESSLELKRSLEYGLY